MEVTPSEASQHLTRKAFIFIFISRVYLSLKFEPFTQIPFHCANTKYNVSSFTIQIPLESVQIFLIYILSLMFDLTHRLKEAFDYLSCGPTSMISVS